MTFLSCPLPLLALRRHQTLCFISPHRRGFRPGICPTLMADVNDFQGMKHWQPSHSQTPKNHSTPAFNLFTHHKHIMMLGVQEVRPRPSQRDEITVYHAATRGNRKTGTCNNASIQPWRRNNNSSCISTARLVQQNPKMQRFLGEIMIREEAENAQRKVEK